jgi:hypothetical protein
LVCGFLRIAAKTLKTLRFYLSRFETVWHDLCDCGS